MSPLKFAKAKTLIQEEISPYFFEDITKNKLFDFVLNQRKQIKYFKTRIYCVVFTTIIRAHAVQLYV